MFVFMTEKFLLALCSLAMLYLIVSRLVCPKERRRHNNIYTIFTEAIFPLQSGSVFYKYAKLTGVLYKHRVIFTLDGRIAQCWCYYWNFYAKCWCLYSSVVLFYFYPTRQSKLFEIWNVMQLFDFDCILHFPLLNFKTIKGVVKTNKAFNRHHQEDFCKKDLFNAFIDGSRAVVV